MQYQSEWYSTTRLFYTCIVALLPNPCEPLFLVMEDHLNLEGFCIDAPMMHELQLQAKCLNLYHPHSPHVQHKMCDLDTRLSGPFGVSVVSLWLFGDRVFPCKLI